MTSKPFTGKSFAICGFPSRQKLQLQNEIKRAGGSLSYLVKNASFVVSPTAQHEGAAYVTMARSGGIPVVSEEYIKACLEAQTIINHSDFLASLNSSNDSSAMEIVSNDDTSLLESTESMEEEDQVEDSSEDVKAKKEVKPKKVFDPSALETNDGTSNVWRSANVFISSTFRDMHGERDWLTRRVFPELQERCNALRVNVCPVDLRWGVTEESSQAQALEICLSEVDNCRPFFVGILGERYGWVYDEYGSISDLPKFEWLRQMPPKCSITHLEMEYGALQKPSASRYILLLRSPTFMKDVSYQHVSDFEPESEHASGMMRSLKSRIKKVCNPNKVFEYPCRWKGSADGKPMVDGLEEFGEKVLEELWKEIQLEFGSKRKAKINKNVAYNELDDLRGYHQRFVELQAGHFVGRAPLLNEISESVFANSLTVVVGEPGSGKSSLVSAFVKRNLNKEYAILEGINTIYHFIGAAPGSTDIRRMLSRVCKEINQICFDDAFEIQEDFTQLKTTFNKMITAVSEKEEKLLLVFDALNQLDDTYQAHDLDWLPVNLPNNSSVRVLVSTLSGPCFTALEDRPEAKIIRVGGLTDTDKRELVEAKLWEYRKKLDEHQMKLLLRKTDAKKPLYLFVACEELRVFGIYEKLQQRLESMAETVPALFGEVLQRLEEDHSRGLVQEALCLLETARGGLLEQELLNILGEGKPLPRSIWAGLYLSLKPYLRPPGEDGQSVLDFFHRQLSKAIRSRYLSNETELKTHRQLANFFVSKADPSDDQSWLNSSYIRSFSELPYHQLKSAQYRDLERTLTDLGFIEIKCAHGMTYELVHDFLTSLDCKEFQPTHAFKEFARFIQSRAYVLNTAPHLTFTTALSLPQTSEPSIEAASRWNLGIEKRPYLQWLHKPQTHHPCLMTLAGHSFPVRSAAISPDPEARLIASASDDKTIKLWSARTGAEIKTLRGHSESVFDLAFSPNGEYLVSGSWDKSWILWNAKTGSVADEQARAHKSTVTTLAFSPDSKYLVTGSRDETIKLWTFKPAENLWTGHGHTETVTKCVFTKCGRRVISASEDKCMIVWDVSTGAEERRLTGNHTKEIVWLSVSNDGTRFASASQDRTTKVWDTSTFEEITTLTGHRDGLCSCSFSADDKYLATTSHDNIIMLWDVSNVRGPYNLMCMLSGHTGSVFCAVFAPDSSYLLSSSFDRSLKVWDMEAVKQIPPSVQGHTARILGSRFSNSGKYFATAARDKSLKVWETFSNQELATLDGHKSNVLDTAFAPFDESLFISVSRDSTMKLWNWKHTKEIKSVVAHKGKANSCDVSPDGTAIITGGDDKLVKIWDWQFRHTGTLYGHRGEVTVCRYSPDGKKIASGSDDCTVKLWDAATRSKLGTFSRHQSTVNCVTFSLDSLHMVVGCDDGLAYEWNAMNGKLITLLRGHTSQVRACTYSNDGKHIITGSTDSQVIMWNSDSKERDCSFACLSRVTTLSSSQLDKTFVVGDGSGTVYLLRPVGLGDETE